jgi:hypothetical protein
MLVFGAAEGLEKLKITELDWDFSSLNRVIEERLEGNSKIQIQLFISLLKGEISPETFPLKD